MRPAGGAAPQWASCPVQAGGSQRRFGHRHRAWLLGWGLSVNRGYLQLVRRSLEVPMWSFEYQVVVLQLWLQCGSCSVINNNSKYVQLI